MERIQSALDRARAKRKSDAPISDDASNVAQNRPKVPHGTTLPDSVLNAWASLTEFEPAPSLLAAHRIPAFERSELSKPLDMLRTKVSQAMSDNSWQRLAMTSPNASCGKTTLSLCLAYSIARQTEQRVALIEMDMRRPNIGATLGLPGKSYQFAEVLEGRGEHRDHLFRIGSNILVGANHRTVRHPSELLQSSTMRAALDELEAVYQPTITIFDMPPMLVSDDMMAFADSVDAALLIAAAENTSIKEVDACETELTQRTNVLGIVLNKCRYMGKEYGYDYYA